VLSNSIQQLSDHILLFACDHKWPTGSARTHTDVSVKWPNSVFCPAFFGAFFQSPALS